MKINYTPPTEKIAESNDLYAMPPDIWQKHAKLWVNVITQNYYINCIPSTLPGHKSSNKEFITFWNDFWLNLPDSPDIHCDLFYSICDFIDECISNDL